MSFAWTPSPELIRDSNLSAFLQYTGMPNYEALLERSNLDRAWFTEQVFRFCDFRWYEPCTQWLDLVNGEPHANWCVGGQTNIVLNCLDRHRGTPTYDRPLLVWAGETEGRQSVRTYREFDAEVSQLSAGLRAQGVGQGDVVALYLPNIPASFIAFFAVLKIGAIVLPLFSGFGPDPIATRLADGRAKCVITCDFARRRGTDVPMKAVLDEALQQTPDVRCVVVVESSESHERAPMQAGRDVWYEQLISGQPVDVPTLPVPAEAAALLLYSSGTTGRPKGCVWTHVGFLGSMVARDMHLCGDFKSSDRFFFMSDMGWMVGAMGACVPTLFGASVLLAEGTPDYPRRDRFWQLVQDHRVTYLGVSPSIVRSLMRDGESVRRFDLSALRITCSGGEAWTESPWTWFFEHVCRKTLPIINISGGTEVGGAILIGTVHHPMNPGSFAAAALAMGADIVDDSGAPAAAGQVGELVLRHASIGMTKSLWHDEARYLETYWAPMPGLWMHGDFARRDADGLYYILGRSDDTIKLSGKRVGPSEIEGALLATGKVTDAAAVAIPDAAAGSVLLCVCVPAVGVEPDQTLVKLLMESIVERMGSSFRPRRIVFADDLPRTRNLKVMRRVVRAVFSGRPVGDLSSLVNPQAVEALRQLA